MIQLTGRNVLMLVLAFLLLFAGGFLFIKIPDIYFIFIFFGFLLELLLVLFATKEAALFFLLPVSFFGLVLIEFAPEGSWKELILGVLQINAVVIFLFFYLWKRESIWAEVRKGISAAEKNYKDLKNENDEWKNSLGDISEQSRFQGVLLGMVQKIIEVLDTNEVKKRLSQLISQSFQNVRYTIKSVGTRMDIFDHWVYQRKVPLMIRDISSDQRFPVLPRKMPWSSLLAAPILIQKEVLEIIRLESEKKDLFHMGHLRIIELLSLMTSIAIDNISLLSSFRDKAIHDGFTGLLNHKYFLERLEEETLFAGRYRNNLGLIMIDIDHFKKFNDNYGHFAGDEVLKRLVKLINSRIRDVDLVARYGGEEFSVLMPEVTYDELYAVSESIRQSFSEERFSFGGALVSASVSLGISMFPKDASTAPQLVRWADQRLYQAKSQGRNRVVG